MTNRSTARRRGFTLVEVLASLVLVGLILPAAMAGVLLAMRAEATARARTEAATLARSRLAEAMAAEEWRAGSDDGDFGEEWPGYSWQLDVEEWETAGMSEVNVTVLGRSGGRELSVAVSTLAYAGGDSGE